MTKNILIVTESMMPFTDNWGACQRVYHYAKKMISTGMQVTVLCRNSSDKVDSEEDVDGIRIIGKGKPIATQKKFGSETDSEKHNLREKLKSIDRNVKFISNIVRGTARFVYSEPNVLSGVGSKKWAKSISPFLLNYITQNKIDAVILSGPSFGSFYLADSIKSTGTKLILDYRDPWTCWYEKATLADLAERKAINAADLVVTTTDILMEALKVKYSTGKVHTIMNGYDKELWNSVGPVKHNPEKLLISYIGAIKINGQPGFRDATVFLKTAVDFLKLHSDVEVSFVGVRDTIDSINPEYRKYIDFSNTVPVKESLVLTAQSDVLLMFHTPLDPSGKYIICGKAFDCLRSGNFVLSIGDKAYANKKLVEDNKIGLHCNNERTAIMNALNDIYDRWKKHSLAGLSENTEMYSREYQNSQLIGLIQALDK